jgi:hypothetical protein
MEEYKIIKDSYKIIQTKLNQWRHDYKITIIHAECHDDVMTVLLKRERYDAE